MLRFFAQKLLRLVPLFLLSAPLGLAAADNAYVNGYRPMLSAPSESSGKAIKNLAHNEVVRIVYTEDTMDAADENQVWVRVRAADGREGYVRAGSLSQQKLAEPEFQVEFRDIEKKSYIAADALYLRSGPTRVAPEKGMLVRNTEVTILEYSDNDDYIDGQTAKWARVRAGEDLDGWVFSGYLSDEPKGGGGGNAGPVEDPQHIMSGSSKKVRPPFLGIRDEPSKYGTVIGRVRQGKSVSIVERLQSWENAAGLRSVWVRVRADNLEGWVFGGFLSSAGYTMSSDSLDKPFIPPLDPGTYRRTCNYGKRTHPTLNRPDFHTGVDLGASGGTPIYAAADGVVELTNDNTGYGLLTVVRHDNGLVTYYAHQSRRRKGLGDRVTAGEVIGEVGTTGNSTGNHLHFEIRSNYGDAHFNPNSYVPFPEVQEDSTP